MPSLEIHRSVRLPVLLLMSLRVERGSFSELSISRGSEVLRSCAVTACHTFLFLAMHSCSPRGRRLAGTPQPAAVPHAG